jgi:hypothetical protein
MAPVQDEAAVAAANAAQAELAAYVQLPLYLSAESDSSDIGL